MDPKQQIIQAATQVFLQKGYQGASIRRIATQAGVNVSMINYYYRSKEKLFDMVFDQLFGMLFAQIGSILDSEMNFFDKIQKTVDQYIDTLKKSPTIPTFVFGELARNPETILERVKNNHGLIGALAAVDRVTNAEIERGTIRKIEPVELWINVISLAVFPFVARPMITSVGAVDDRMFDRWIESRKKSITQFIIDSIKI